MGNDPACTTGLCGTDVPPLVGSVLTGVGMTLPQAARALEQGRELQLTDVQRRLVEQWAERQLGDPAR
ncbi:hypothetical protein [Conexibacter arvalis]|uniref:Uncharacterized protein n=1 Tax=Conexibacter arvalis TaxID=912552 RepID=A0A840IF97_9ACTN|nr:hypothetical protein [Conexibacter arvalis]MBB4663486.1 hypothetical protein [Conexibacter arvalis]